MTATPLKSTPKLHSLDNTPWTYSAEVDAVFDAKGVLVAYASRLTGPLIVDAVNTVDAYRQDMADVAGAFSVPIPPPGSDMARIMVVNSILRRENAENYRMRNHVREAGRLLRAQSGSLVSDPMSILPEAREAAERIQTLEDERDQAISAAQRLRVENERLRDRVLELESGADKFALPEVAGMLRAWGDHHDLLAPRASWWGRACAWLLNRPMRAWALAMSFRAAAHALERTHESFYPPAAKATK